MHFEELERRQLLALPINNANIVQITAAAYVTAGNDVLELIVSGGNLQLRNGAGTVIDSRAIAGVAGINVDTGAGNDFVRMGRADGTLMPGVPITVHGGAGNDTLTGGNSADQIFGDTENDRLDGRAGGDVINGGAGFDTADYGYRARSTNLSLANSNTANDGTTLGNNSTPDQYNDNGSDNLVDIEAAIGSSNADYMTGSDAANWFDGGGGNDTVFGGAGIDSITGGVNTDLAYGDADADFFFFQDATADQFLGGAGTTSAQYDAALDTPAPAAVAAAAFKASFLSSMAEDSGPLEIDDTFDGGRVVMSLNGSLAQINDVAIQYDDIGEEQFEEKIVVVGSMLSTSSESYDFLIARYNSDGTLDDTFGDGGIVLIDFGMNEFFSTDAAMSLAIGEDGKIIVVGGAQRTIFTDGGTFVYSEYAMARVLEDGDLDGDFGSGGIALGAPDDVFSYDIANRVVIQSVEVDNDIFEERYIVTGDLGSEILTDASNSVDWGTLRVTNDGDIDGSFGGGLIRTDFSDIEFASDDHATGLAIDPQTGNVWVSGYMELFGSQFVVKGFTGEGDEIDGAEGFSDFGEQDAAAYDAVISGSRLVVVGEVFLGEEPSGAGIATFDISEELGSLVNYTYFTTETQDQAFRAVAVDNDGMGVAAGNWGDDFYIQRFDISDLSADDAPVLVDFGPQLDKPQSVDAAYGIAVQSDGKVVVAGIADDPYAAIVRLSSEPVEPPFVDVNLDGPTIQSMGFFIAGNTGDPVPNYLVDRLRSLKPDGTVELSGTEFDDIICVSEKDGIVTVSINGELFQYNAAQVTKIVIDGLGGNDVIKAEECLNIPVEFRGGAGHDLLIGANLGDAFYGGIGNDVIFGLKGDDYMDGEGGNDLLVGGLGRDKMFGGDGRDLLIGGLGADLLRGGADDDILIGGFTIYDLFAELLLKLRDEWCFTGRNWSQRFENLSSPLARGYNGLFFLKANWTVYNDGETDDLGGDGGRDWFFADTKGADADKIKDKTSEDYLSSF